MSGQHTRYQFLLRQRLTANGLNSMADYTARLTYAALEALLSADGQVASGVVDGLLCTVQVGTLNVSIGGGLAVLYDTLLGLPDARHHWIEVQHTTPLTKTLDPGDPSPRWDLIEIAPNQVDGPPEILDFYDPQLGVAVPLAASPTKTCAPIVTVTKGTPAASPKFPAGNNGRIPLAYIYVPAGAVALSEFDIVYCRPIRKPRTSAFTPTTIDVGHHWQVKGGGLQVVAGGQTGRIVNEMTGFFPGSSTPFLLSTNQACTLSVNNYDGGGLPVSSIPVYAYAVPWPFPAGSDPTLAPREFYCRNPALFASGGLAVGQQGCMIVWTSAPPVVTNQGPANAGGLAAFNHPNVGPFTVAYEDMVYVGSAFYDQALGIFVFQRSYGAIVGPTRKPGVAIDALLPIAAPVALPINVNAPAEPTYQLPAHIRHFRMLSRYDVGLLGWIYVEYQDPFETAGGAYPAPIYHEEVSPNAPIGNISDDRWLHLTDNQELVVVLADANPFGPMRCYVYEYEDPIVAMR